MVGIAKARILGHLYKCLSDYRLTKLANGLGYGDDAATKGGAEFVVLVPRPDELFEIVVHGAKYHDGNLLITVH